jgi:predicted peptidase
LAQANSPFEKHVFVHGADALPYRLLRPAHVDPGQSYPLVIFLHGSGERGTDNEKQLIHGTRLFADSIVNYPCFMIVPQCPEGRRWCESDWSALTPVQPEEISATSRLLMQLSDSLARSLPVDQHRMYITGLSMGAQGSLDLLYRFPNTFAAALTVCGTADVKIAPVIKDIPLWMFHGNKDDVVPFEAADKLYKAITKAGGQVKFTTLDNVGHNAWDYAYKEPELLAWLFSQKR